MIIEKTHQNILPRYVIMSQENYETLFMQEMVRLKDAKEFDKSHLWGLTMIVSKFKFNGGLDVV
jgi:hypothetical protein